MAVCRYEYRKQQCSSFIALAVFIFFSLLLSSLPSKSNILVFRMTNALKAGSLLSIRCWNVFALGLFLSPIHTFRRIIRNGSTEQFSGLPYIYTLLNCLLCLWYGTPLVSTDNILVATVNSIGAIFQLVYSILFIIHAEKAKKTRMVGLLVGVFVLFFIVVVGSLQIVDFSIRRTFVGFLSCASLVSMFASPLFIINLVIRTRSVEFMPFYLSLSAFLMSTSFFLYGIFNYDAFIYVPNGIGIILGSVQLVLYFYYSRVSGSEFSEPLVFSYA